MRRFEGKTAIVTGAGSGIGQEMARQLQEEGRHVADSEDSVLVHRTRGGGNIGPHGLQLHRSYSGRRSRRVALDRDGAGHLAPGRETQIDVHRIGTVRPDVHG